LVPLGIGRFTLQSESFHPQLHFPAETFFLHDHELSESMNKALSGHSRHCREFFALPLSTLSRLFWRVAAALFLSEAKN
jgi:hypothetical protein